MFDKQRKDLVNAARTRAELEKVARILGYSDGWVYNTLKHRKNKRTRRMPENIKKIIENRNNKKLLKKKNNDAWDW